MANQNMRKIVVTEWMTLNGVFDADTMDQWEKPYFSDDRWEFIKQGILACDAFLIGRETYNTFSAFWPTQKNNELGVADKLNSAPKYVVSSTMKKAEWNNSTIINKNVVEEIATLKQSGHGRNGDILIPGSATLVKSLMETDLIDEYQFIVHPIIMGSGKRFFREDMNMTRLKLVETKTFSLGAILLRYQPEKK